MVRHRGWSIVGAISLVGLLGAAPARPAWGGELGELVKGEVKLEPARWRGTRHALQLLAEQARFRYAVPNAIGRRAFPGCVPPDAVNRLASSQFIPLREAAARLTPCLGERGKPLADKLTADPSPTVRTAATRSLRAWADPAGLEGHASSWPGSPADPTKRVPPADRKGWWQEPLDLAVAAEQVRTAPDHNSIWRTTGRKIGYLGTPEATKALIDAALANKRWADMLVIPLAEWNGRPEAIEHLKRRANEGSGWGLWGLSSLLDGAALAEALTPILQGGRARWDAPAEFTVARWAGVYAARPLLAGMEKRGHWVCLALGQVAGPGPWPPATRSTTS